MCCVVFLLLRCGHCKQFVPTYEKIAQALKESDPPVPVAKVDATKATAVAGRFEVSGYPTIKILKNGQPVDYEGDRTEAGKKERQNRNAVNRNGAHLHMEIRKLDACNWKPLALRLPY